MQGHKDLLHRCHWQGSSGSPLWMSCYAKEPLLYLLKATMKLPKVQETSKRPRVPFTCKCKNRKSYSWRQRVRQKCKCQTLANRAKSSVCLAQSTQTEAFLAQEIISPGKTTWNCFNVRKRILFATLLSCQENCCGMEDGSFERWARAHRQCMDLQDFTITHWSLPNGGGNMPAIIVLPPKMRPITLTLFQANSFW